MAADAGQLRGVLGGLALRVVEVGGHGDDGAVQVCFKSVFGAVAQRGQYVGADLDRRLFAMRRLDAHHAGLVDQPVGQLVAAGDVGGAAAHQALDRGDGVLGILRGVRQRVMADLAATAR